MGDDSHKLFIGGVSWDTTDEALRNYFGKYGEIQEAKIMRDSAGKSRGFGFVTYKDPAVSSKVLNISNLELDGRRLDAKSAVPRGAERDGGRGGPRGGDRRDSYGGGRDRRDSYGGGGRGGGRDPRAPYTARTNKIFVGGIMRETKDDELRNYFGKFGKVTDVTIMTDRESGRPRGFAFVTFDNDDMVEQVMSSNQHSISGRQIECKKAVPKSEQAGWSRGGGGPPPREGRGGRGDYDRDEWRSRDAYPSRDRGDYRGGDRDYGRGPRDYGRDPRERGYGGPPAPPAPSNGFGGPRGRSDGYDAPPPPPRGGGGYGGSSGGSGYGGGGGGYGSGGYGGPSSGPSYGAQAGGSSGYGSSGPAAGGAAGGYGSRDSSYASSGYGGSYGGAASGGYGAGAASSAPPSAAPTSAPASSGSYNYSSGGYGSAQGASSSYGSGASSGYSSGQGASSGYGSGQGASSGYGSGQGASGSYGAGYGAAVPASRSSAPPASTGAYSNYGGERDSYAPAPSAGGYSTNGYSSAPSSAQSSYGQGAGYSQGASSAPAQPSSDYYGSQQSAAQPAQSSYDYSSYYGASSGAGASSAGYGAAKAAPQRNDRSYHPYAAAPRR